MTANGLPIEVLRARIRRAIVARENYERVKLAQVKRLGSLVSSVFDGLALACAFWGFWVYVSLPLTDSVRIGLSWLVLLTCLFVFAGRIVHYWATEKYRVRP